MLPERAARTETLIGKEALARLAGATVLLIGLGGVGGYTLEALARAGVGTLWIVDMDRIAESNCNRQILAVTETIGMGKAEAALRRVHSISPDLTVHPLSLFVDGETIGDLLNRSRPDYVIDAIDTVSSKLAIIEAAVERSIPVISSMGTGNHLDASSFVIGDLAKSSVCPLARVMRVELRRRGIHHVTALWSTEKPLTRTVCDGEQSRHAPASISYAPAVAGMLIAGHVIRSLIGELPH